MRLYRPYRARDRAAHRGNRPRDAGERRCSMNAPDDRDPRDDLEDALVSIEGVVDVLYVLGKADNGIAYLGAQLRKHYEEAHDAYSRIYKLDEYHEREAQS